MWGEFTESKCMCGSSCSEIAWSLLLPLLGAELQALQHVRGWVARVGGWEEEADEVGRTPWSWGL